MSLYSLLTEDMLLCQAALKQLQYLTDVEGLPEISG